MAAARPRWYTARGPGGSAKRAWSSACRSRGARAPPRLPHGRGAPGTPAARPAAAGGSPGPAAPRGPDALRGGYIVAVQPFDAAGRPAGDPILAKAQPGTIAAERWTVAPGLKSEWTFSLTGRTALPLAALREVRVEVEP